MILGVSKLKLTVLIIGCGDIGVTLGQELLNDGHRVIGVRRQANALEHTGIEPLSLDLNDLEGADASALPQADYVIYTVSADRFEESAYQSAYPDGLKRVLSVLEQHDTPPRRIFFVSSTSVYGQQEGEVVNEESPTESTSFSGNLMREAEQALLGAILVNNDAFYRVSDFLKPVHFYEALHRKIFETAGELIRMGKAANPVTLKTFLPAEERVGAEQVLLDMLGFEQDGEGDVARLGDSAGVGARRATGRSQHVHPRRIDVVA